MSEKENGDPALDRADEETKDTIRRSCTVSKESASKESALECRNVLRRVGGKLNGASFFMRTLGDADAMQVVRITLRDTVDELHQLRSQLEELEESAAQSAG